MKVWWYVVLLFLFFPVICSALAHDSEYIITVNVSKQELFLFESAPFENVTLIKVYPVSTSKYGTGNQIGSNKTPLGTHFIAEKIGTGAKIGTIFQGRINTGMVAEIYTDATDIEEDYITTRILWLQGIEPEINQNGEISSYNRYIYIHGTPAEGLIGKSASNGCIRMKNQDIVELFKLVPEGTLVIVH